MQPVIITTTTETLDEAKKIGRLLVEKKMAACVNIIGPIASIYTWEDKIEEAQEYKLLIKSFMENWPAVREQIKAVHSYTVPEITLLNAEQMNPEYLAWMDKVCQIVQ